MDVSEVDQDAEDEEEDYEEERGKEDTYPYSSLRQTSSSIARQSSYHHIPSQAYQYQGHNDNANETQSNYHSQQQHKSQVQHQNPFGSHAQQHARRIPAQLHAQINRHPNSNGVGYHQPRPPPRHPLYPAHSVVSAN